MSDTFDAAAHAAATEAAFARPDSGVPQADQNAETQAEPTAPPASAEQTDDVLPEDAHETKSRAEQRIRQLNAREREAREEAAYWRGIAEQQMRQQPQSAGGQPAPQLPPDLAQYVGAQPKPDDFPAGEYDPAYQDAKVEWRFREREAKAELMRRVALQQQQKQAFQSRIGNIVEQGAAKYEDFADKVLADDVPLTSPIVAGLVRLRDGAEDVAYALATDRKEAQRLAALKDPIEVALEIGAIRERSKRAREAPPPQPTSAPEPPPRAARGGNVGHRDFSKMSMDEYAKVSEKIFGGVS
jgi:hypothetical protein